MQIKTLLLLSLLSLAFAAQAPPEPEPETTSSSEGSDGLVFFILTYSQDLSCSALETKCKKLNCTRIICGVVKQLVVLQDPSGLGTLSVDPSLSIANQDVQVSLMYTVMDVISVANASDEMSPPWHHDPINQASLPLDGYYSSLYTGIGVHIYLIDTGVQTNHPEFLNAAGTASRVVAGGWSYDETNNTEDCNRHGTATASLACGGSVGIGPNATLHAVRAVSCGGTAQTADLISALNYVALNAEMPTIVSMSVGAGTLITPLELAVDNTVGLFNISVIVAAGNGAEDACSTSPPLSAYVAAVGATVVTCQIAEYSNTGKCVNVYAPGSDIYCANIDSGYQKVSGTSIACPIVTGVMGPYFQYNNSLTTYDITDTIYRSRTRGNVLTGLPEDL